MFLDPEASQENLKRPEKAPKRHPKRHPKVVQKLVKKRSISAPKNEQKKTPQLIKKIALTGFFPDVFGVKKKEWSNLGMFFEHFWEQFWGPILVPDRPKRGQDEPKRAIRSFKEPKSCIFKNLKKPAVFFSVFGSRGFQENLKRPEKAPKRHPKRHPKVVQTLVKQWSNSEPKNEQK